MSERREGAILVVDDDADLRAVTVLLLRRSLATDVVGVADGQTALELALRTPVALIVTDVDMPGMDGRELIRRLRADARTRELPVVAVSGGTGRVQALAAGASAFLSKPFAPRRLVDEARRWLEAEFGAASEARSDSGDAARPRPEPGVGRPDAPSSS